MNRVLFMAIAIVLGASCSEAPPPSTQSQPSSETIFEEVLLGSGLESSFMRSGSEPSTSIVEVKGGGLALIDIENDGDLDLFMPNGATLQNPDSGPGARLYRNLIEQGEGLRFQDVTPGSGLEGHRAWSFGVAAGDVDGNGFDDLVVATLGHDRLYLNQGDGTFLDASEEWGLLGVEEWSTSAALGDLDQDGDLDLYIAHYLEFDPEAPTPTSKFKGIEVLAGPRGMKPIQDTIYENTSSGFVDRTSEVLGDLPARYALNLAMVDVDGNGMLDIYVGNDSQGNYLLRNKGEWDFEEVGVLSGAATNLEGDAQATMGIAVADVGGNGFPDFYSTNFSNDTNTLHTNLDGRFFDDRSNRYGLLAGSRALLGWACEFGDFDNDGDEDLVVFNGHVYPQATPRTMDSSYEQSPVLWLRNGDRFEISPDSGLGGPHRDRTAVFADLDLDGDLDIVAGELNGSLRLYRNTTDGLRGFIVRPEQPLGTRVDVTILSADGSLRSMRRWIRGGGPFQSTAAPEAHFGLPPGAEIESVSVLWPDGLEHRAEAIESSRRLEVPRPGS